MQLFAAACLSTSCILLSYRRWSCTMTAFLQESFQPKFKGFGGKRVLTLMLPLVTFQLAKVT